MVVAALPPLNFKKTEKLCPRIAPAILNTAINSNQHLLAGISIELKVDKKPFAQSKIKTVLPQNEPMIRLTLVAPGLPLPTEKGRPMRC